MPLNIYTSISYPLDKTNTNNRVNRMARQAQDTRKKTNDDLKCAIFNKLLKVENAFVNWKHFWKDFEFSQYNFSLFL